jgi:hypothetical protein
MSEVLEAFWKRASWDPVLQARLKTIRSGSTEEAIADLVQIGREFGFPFSAEDYRRSLPAIASGPLPTGGKVAPEPSREPETTAPREVSSSTKVTLASSKESLRAEELDRDPRGVPPQESYEASTCCSHTDADY